MKIFYTVRMNGITLEAKPLTTHTNMLRGFIMYYKRKCRENIFPLTEYDVKNITKAVFYAYCGSLDYHDDLASFIDETSSVKGEEVCPGIDDVAVSPSTQDVVAISKSMKNAHVGDHGDGYMNDVHHKRYVTTDVHVTTCESDADDVMTTDVMEQHSKTYKVFRY